MIWFLSIFIVMNDGTATNIIKTANKPEYNNEQECLSAGKASMEAMAPDVIGKGRIYYACNGIAVSDLKKALVSGESF